MEGFSLSMANVVGHTNPLVGWGRRGVLALAGQSSAGPALKKRLQKIVICPILGRLVVAVFGELV